MRDKQVEENTLIYEVMCSNEHVDKIRSSHFSVCVAKNFGEVKLLEELSEVNATERKHNGFVRQIKPGESNYEFGDFACTSLTARAAPEMGAYYESLRRHS